MKIDDTNDKKRKIHLIEQDNLNDDETGGQGDSGSGGQTGEIHFRFKDAMSLDPRDDMLPPSEIKRLLIIHKDLHKERVDKQKITRKERLAIKEGRVTQTYGQTGYGMGVSAFKTHPITSKAQFSGIVDKKVIGIPSEFDADINEDKRNELEQRYVNRNTPKFSPKFRPPGM